MPDESLRLDEVRTKFENFYSLRNTDSSQADAVLSELGASDEADRQIILEVAAPKPLWRTDRFLDAHTLAVRSLEVLDRNATRKISMPKIGPLVPIARFFVELVTRFIVRSHLRSVTDNMFNLYARREANCLPDDPARGLLRRARTDMERIMPGFRRNPLGLPTFLLGGAAVSSVLSWLQDAFGVFGSSSIWTIVSTAILLMIAAFASWVILRGAAVAHRRIKLTTDSPVGALYETIGRAGKPPNDQAGLFAVIAIVLTLLALLVVPIGLAITALS